MPDKSNKVITNPKLSAQAVNKKETEGMERYPDVYTEHRPGTIIKHTLEADGVLFQCDQNIQLRVRLLTKTIVQIQYGLGNQIEQAYSYAVDQNFQASKVAFEFSKKAKRFLIKTKLLQCHISKEGMHVQFSTLEGASILEDETGFYARSTILKGIEEVKISKKAPKGEAYFGLGDKAGALNLRGQKHSNYTTDAFGFSAKDTELYRAIPFYYGLKDELAYGIFLDNTYRSHFDFDGTKKGVTSLGAEGGQLNYYFIYGPKLNSVARQYAQLSGRPELPPLWALGFHQCRWSYFPEQRVIEVAEEFRRRKIPCDAIYLDIDYMDDYKCFTWNRKHFPDPSGMIELLASKGFHTVVMIDPGIKVDEQYKVYTEGIEKDVFCRRPDGELMKGPVWPSECVWPDYTNPAIRKWWGKCYQKLYLKQKVSGFWNDMNEPAVFQVHRKTFPDDVRHDYDGYPCSHRKAHNIYGLAMSRATYEGLKALNPEKRPFLLSRATFAGGQRFASVWTGDNIADWKHLRYANRQCQRMSVSGFSFVGSDIGGFVDRPSGELFVRWLQLGIFHPFYRVHSMGNNADGAAEVDKEAVAKSEAEQRLDQEPWSFGEEYTIHAKAAIELRYQLLPYIYTTFWKYVQDGSPMIRSLVFYDQADPICKKRQKEFLFGEHILVSPVQKAGKNLQKTYLPKGQWYDYWTGKSYAGKQKIITKATINQIPFFVKAGTVLPKYPITLYTGAPLTSEPNLFIYYHNKQTISHLYEDKGEGYGYQKDKYSLKTYTTEGSETSFSLQQSKLGKFKNPFPSVRLLIHGLPFEPKSCLVNGQSVKYQLIEIAGIKTYALSTAADFKQVLIKA